GEGDGAAYASWTPTPDVVTTRELAAVELACRDELHRPNTSIDADRAALRLSERRGQLVVLLYRTEDPDLSAACVVRNPAGSSNAQLVDLAIGGSSGPALSAPARGFTQGTVSQFEELSMTDGAVGEQVTGVTIHAGTFTVTASVANGRYVAWWPGPAFEARPDRPGAAEGDASALILTYDLTLDDGTVIRDADPTRPS
ncbi:MAG TPA: hypothetical protein VGR21_09775, partial [Cryptosporangiaceae bacterium]|nr:hypothetical protein [Cryptosporangiaceae bacterium]